MSAHAAVPHEVAHAATEPGHRSASEPRRRHNGAVRVLAGLLLAMLALSPLVSAQEAALAGEPMVVASLDRPDEELTGRAIYQRVLDNRFDTYIQESKLISGDRGGNSQLTALKMWFKNFRGEDGKPREGIVLSKALVRYTEPFDIRHSGYLVVANLDRANDQFVYRNSSRKVRRVNLRGEAVFGTDFSFEDVIPREIEDATYERQGDDAFEGIPCYTVEAIPKPETRSEYSRFLVYVDKEKWIPLRTRYWDERGLEVKELKATTESIVLMEDVWVPMKMTMRHHQLESFTTLAIEALTPNPDLKRTTFDLRRLEGH